MAVAIGGEIIFGLAMGMILSFIFVAVQWGGEIMGQQMGLNLGQTFDPQFGSAGSMVGDIYFFLALTTFLAINGHLRDAARRLRNFTALPPLSVGINVNIVGMITGLFQGATLLAMQLAAPVLVTMLIVDVVLGFIGKTVPQLNIMSAGLALRSLVGTAVLIVGIKFNQLGCSRRIDSRNENGLSGVHAAVAVEM